MTLKDWLWIPNKSVGKIKFDTPIEIYAKTMDIELRNPTDPITGWSAFDVKNEDVSIYVEKEIVVAVDVDKYLYFQGKNIIGIVQSDLIKVLGIEPNEVGPSVLYEDGDFQTVLMFDPLSLQIWIRDDCVISANCSNDFD